MAKLPYTLRLCLAVLLTSFFAGLSGILMHELLNVVDRTVQFQNGFSDVGRQA